MSLEGELESNSGSSNANNKTNKSSTAPNASSMFDTNNSSSNTGSKGVIGGSNNSSPASFHQTGFEGRGGSPAGHSGGGSDASLAAAMHKQLSF